MEERGLLHTMLALPLGKSPPISPLNKIPGGPQCWSGHCTSQTIIRIVIDENANCCEMLQALNWFVVQSYIITYMHSQMQCHSVLTLYVKNKNFPYSFSHPTIGK
jgi:hypothetical protein